MIDKLKEAGGIYLDNIQEGFDHYKYKVVKMNQEEVYSVVKNLWIFNGTDNSYADFYYYKLDDVAKKKVEAVLNKEEIQYLNSISNTDNIIFHLDDILLGILIKLNYNETLFSTFYFTKEPCTMWGNYNQEYVIFQNK